MLKKCGHAKGKARFRANSVVTRSVELNVDIVKYGNRGCGISKGGIQN